MTRDADPLAALAALCAEAEALSAAATPGPWDDEELHYWLSGDVQAAMVRHRAANHSGHVVAACHLLGGGKTQHSGTTRPEENARFIARARSLLPKLAAVARAVVDSSADYDVVYEHEIKTRRVVELDDLARALSDAGPKDDKEGK